MSLSLSESRDQDRKDHGEGKDLNNYGRSLRDSPINRSLKKHPDGHHQEDQHGNGDDHCDASCDAGAVVVMYCFIVRLLSRFLVCIRLAVQ